MLETIFQPQFTQTDLVNLGFAQIYLTLMIDGVGSPPFSATTIAPFDPPPQKFVDQVIQSSRTQYATPRAHIEAALVKWQESDPVVAEPPKPKRDYSRSSPPSSSARPYSAPVRSEPRPQPSERPAPPAPQPHRTPEVREAQAKAVGETIAHEHAIATSKAMNEEQPMPPPPKQEHREQHERSNQRERSHPDTRNQKPKSSTPPLEGSKSLREALQAVTGERAPGPRIHAPDLKATIHNVAPHAAGSGPHKKTGPAELPENELRAMLAVDEIDEEHTS